ncbi:MAG TPA: hypothetical protein VHX49_12610 [Candidatus Acidoferrales bacterium]|nr:hypothetical protein [Candidatus Acidoferrales bacterium]
MGRKIAAILLVCVALGVSLGLWVTGPRAKISAQDLLREAARDQGPLGEIFEQQAGQGYYTDALETARRYASGLPARDQANELAGFAEKLIEIRAENGDIQGAKQMAECVKEIAWAWTLKGQPRVVVDWARSLPLANEERGYALLGVAQALAHPRPK